MESPRVTIESDSFQRASFGLFSGARRVFQLWNEAQKKHLSFVPKPIVEVAGGVSRVEMNAKNSALDIPPAITGALSRKTVDRSRRCHTRRYDFRRPVRNAGVVNVDSGSGLLCPCASPIENQPQQHRGHSTSDQLHFKSQLIRRVPRWHQGDKDSQQNDDESQAARNPDSGDASGDEHGVGGLLAVRADRKSKRLNSSP